MFYAPGGDETLIFGAILPVGRHFFIIIVAGSFDKLFRFARRKSPFGASFVYFIKKMINVPDYRWYNGL